jgi:uncharacterized membrane protein YeiH
MSASLELWLEIIGTVAFSISGAMLGLKKGMDIFGVAILGLTTAVGGGVLRDLMLGNTPPAMFQDPLYALVALAVAVVVFLPPIQRLLDRVHGLYDAVMLVMDSVGLGIFTVVGIQTAYGVCQEPGTVLLISVGMLTGVGGGVMRDIMAGDMPYIFVRHFYACASLLGAVACIVLWDVVGQTAAMLIGAVLVTVLRFCAARYRWSLPKAKFYMDKNRD